MPSWLLKAAVQGTISVLPARQRLNALLQQRVTGSLALSDAMFERKLAHCAHHLERFAAARDARRPPRRALELGTGWYPVVPVGMALCGVGQVVTIDVSSLLEPRRVAHVLGRYAEAFEAGLLAERLPQLDPERARELRAIARQASTRTAPELLEAVGVRALVGDARIPRLAAASVELFVSNNTFEHIPPSVLEGILAAFRRLSTPGAVMDHFIDISDHYAHFDGSISEFNYLRFSPRAWSLFNNSLQYQSRLRASDYRRLIERAGFAVVAEEAQRGDLAELERTPLAPAFQRYAREELLVLRTWLTAVAGPDSTPALPGKSAARPSAR